MFSGARDILPLLQPTHKSMFIHVQGFAGIPVYFKIQVGGFMLTDYSQLLQTTMYTILKNECMSVLLLRLV